MPMPHAACSFFRSLPRAVGNLQRVHWILWRGGGPYSPRNLQPSVFSEKRSNKMTLTLTKALQHQKINFMFLQKRSNNDPQHRNQPFSVQIGERENIRRPAPENMLRNRAGCELPHGSPAVSSNLAAGPPLPSPLPYW